MTIPKPSPRPRSEPKRIRPKCACGHSYEHHVSYGTGGVTGCAVCPLTLGCRKYKPARLSIRRAAPPARKARIKSMPKCKHCAHPGGKHWTFEGGVPAGHSACERCAACPGYEPARGKRQKRRTPEAAIRGIADGLWTRVVHARPGSCEVQQYHPHVCVGGYQAMHGIPRTFSATRFLPVNGFKGCAGTHKYFTDRPEAWSALLLEAWGLETFRELWARARSSEKPDMATTVASLRAELARLED
jgi:hypothetical protein